MIKETNKVNVNKKPDNKQNTIKNKPIIENGIDYNLLWQSLAMNYSFVEGAQISNSFICLLALYEKSPEQLSTTQITEHIVTNTQSKIYRISATLRDALEHRLKPAGYVEGMDIASEHSTSGRKPIRMSLYKITDKGRRLLEAWIAFLLDIERSARATSR